MSVAPGLPGSSFSKRPDTLAAPKGGRPAVMVASHERSGTHFMINSLVSAYGYSIEPRMDLDHVMADVPFNVYNEHAMAQFMATFGAGRYGNIVKSHYAVEFFDAYNKKPAKGILVFYIHRDPASVILSYWRYTMAAAWREGPKIDDPIAFATAEPEGLMLRYQWRSPRTILHRWAQHVEGWTEAAKKNRNIIPVRYDELNDSYAETIKSFRAVLKLKPLDLTKPDADKKVILAKAAVRGGMQEERKKIAEIARREVGDTMKALGY